METLLTLANYILRILPGIVFIILFFLFIKPGPKLRTIVYIFTFVLFRDAMTPLGLWRFGQVRGFLWIRLSNDPWFLVAFGLSSLLIVAALYLFDKENRPHLIWFQNNIPLGLLVGLGGALLVVLPIFLVAPGVPIENRGGQVSLNLIVPILIFALFGNLLEEGLFRGYVMGILKERQRPIIAGVSSGVVFAFCHIFLALTVTNIGLAILLFTLWEGCIAGLIASRYGIVPATLTHGGAIFLLSSGLF